MHVRIGAKILALLIPAILVAQTRAEEGFFSAAELAGPANAAIRFEVLGGVFSGVLLSPEGYALTVMHSLPSLGALTRPEGGEPEYASPFLRQHFGEPTPDFLITQNRGPQGASFMARVGAGQNAGEIAQRHSVEIVFMGAGMNHPAAMNRRLRQMRSRQEPSPQDLLKAQSFVAQDFAIVKLPKEAVRDVPCAPVAKLPARPGDRIWIVGYPNALKRSTGSVPSGNPLYFTAGVVQQDFNQGTLSHELKISPRDCERLLTSPNSIVSDADGGVGMSGSMMINGRGEVVGMYTAGFTGQTYVSPSALGIRIEHIQNEVSSIAGADTAAGIFDCRP